MKSPNFSFLSQYDQLLCRSAAQAELYLFTDPNIALIKLRQVGELIAQEIAARSGTILFENNRQVDVLQQEQLVINLIKQQGTANRQDVMNLCQLDKDRAYRLLKQLHTKVPLIQEGRGTATVYRKAGGGGKQRMSTRGSEKGADFNCR